MIRAKFHVNSVLDQGFGQQVVMSPVYAGPDASEEDKAFWQSTPNGSLTMTITNPDAQLQAGKCYYLTFEEVPEA
jgi:hypothetical protein